MSTGSRCPLDVARRLAGAGGRSWSRIAWMYFSPGASASDAVVCGSSTELVMSPLDASRPARRRRDELVGVRARPGADRQPVDHEGAVADGRQQALLWPGQKCE